MDTDKQVALAYLTIEYHRLVDDLKLPEDRDRVEQALARAHLYATLWAAHRRLPLGSPGLHDEAIRDATAWLAEHDPEFRAWADTRGL